MRPTLAAVGLGAAAGLRTLTPPAVLALRRRQAPAPARWAMLAAAIGELIGDKHPSVPDRRTALGMTGRLASGMTCGWATAGARGAVAAGAAAMTSGLALVEVRAWLVEATGLPDPALGVAEDALALALSYVAAAPGA